MTGPAALAAAVAMTPLMAAVIWWDLRALRIPNPLVLGVVAVFAVCGAWGLPLGVFGLSLAAGLVALACGIGVYALSGGQVGAGDLKLIAALVPFVARADAGGVLLLWALLAVVGLVAQRAARALVAGRPTGWAVLDQGTRFPVGVLLGATLTIYLWWRVTSAA